MNKSQEVKIIIKANTNDAEKNIENVNSNLKKTKTTADSTTKSLKNINDKLTLPNLQTLIYGIKQITSSLQSSVQASVDYIENVNLTQTAFGRSADEGIRFANTIAEIYGFDESNVIKQVGTFRQFGEALGFADEKANMLGKNLTLFASDISSLYNISFEQASEKLSSALTGQTKAIRSLGADITMASLQQQLYNMGINESITDMNRAEKVLLIYLSLTKQLANAQGDLAKTIESPSNQIKIMREQIARLSRAFGNMLLPILSKILPVINGVLMALVEIFNFIAILLGYDPVDFDYGISLNDSFDDAAGSILDTNDALDGTNKKLDETKKKLTGLRGFDKLNVINTPAESSNTGGSGGSGGGVGGVAGGGINSKLLDALKDYDAHLDRINKKATRIRNAILEWLGFTRDANGEWKFTEWTFGSILTVALGILAAIRLAWKIAKLFGAGEIIKSLKYIAGLLGGAGAGSGTIAGIIAAIIVMVTSIITNFITFNKVIDDGYVGLKTTLSTWEKISLIIGFLNPAINLTASSWALVKDALSKAVREVDLFDNSISKATKDKVKPLYDDIVLLDKKFNEIYLKDKVISKNDVQTIKERLASISEAILDELSSDRNTSLENLSLIEQFLSEEDYQNILDSTNKYYDNQEEIVTKNEAKINKIVSKAQKEGRKLRKDELQKISKLREEINNTGLKAMTESEEEFARLQIRIGSNRNAISVEQASEYIQTAADTRDKAIEEANKQYEGIVLEAQKMRDAGLISDEEYNKIVTAAGKAKDETISDANEQYDEILKTTKEKMGENSKFINDENGKIKSNWQVAWEQIKETASKAWESIKNTFSEKWKEIKNGIKTFLEDIKSSIQSKWNSIKSWVKNNILIYFTKTYWRNKFDSIKSAVREKLEDIKSSIQSKWSSIKSWVKNNILKYFTKSYWTGKWNNIKSAIKLPHFEWTEGPKATGLLKKVLEKAKLPTFVPKLSVKWYAEGGFPDDGELFIAREKGPELVGSIGNRTAVANNDQIVEAVSIGVAKAIQNAGSKNTRVVIEAKGDASGLMNFITFKQKEQERQYGL